MLGNDHLIPSIRKKCYTLNFLKSSISFSELKKKRFISFLMTRLKEKTFYMFSVRSRYYTLSERESFRQNKWNEQNQLTIHHISWQKIKGLNEWKVAVHMYVYIYRITFMEVREWKRQIISEEKNKRGSNQRSAFGQLDENITRQWFRFMMAHFL